MASIREHRLKTGETTWGVLYRRGGRQTSTTFADQKKAEKFKTLLNTLGVDEALDLLAKENSKGGIALDDLAAQWFDWKARDVEPRTIVDYRRDYDNWISPFLGHLPAEAITEGDVQDWVDRRLSKKLSAKSVADRHAILHGIFKWASAKSRGKVSRNPCTETELPRRKKGAPKGLTMTEWLALKDASAQVSPKNPTPARVQAVKDAADLILFMASTGWRIGEATALTVQGVEDGQPMYVTMHQVQRKGVGIAQGGKSAAASRRISVSKECAAMIRRRIVGKRPSDLVFTNAEAPAGAWEASTFRRRYWAAAVKLAGLEDRKPTPHWLRHTHVMLCHAAGMSLPEIQRRIGHEDIQTTINVYGRMVGDADEETMDKLDRLLSGNLPVKGEVVRDQSPELE